MKPTIEGMLKFGYTFIATKDLAPDQPIFRYIIEKRGLDLEQQLWLSFLYMAYSSVPSAIAALRDIPYLADPTEFASRLYCAVERRGFRTPSRLVKHWMDFTGKVRAAGSIYAWTTQGWTGDPEANYERFWERSQTIWGNGRWAAFGWAELLKKINGLPISAPDIRLEFCSGPKDGLCALYGVPTTTPIPKLNRYAIQLRNRLLDLGLGMGLDQYVLDWETMETLLCDYNKFTKGTYRVGDHIKEVYVDIQRAKWLHPADMALLYEARAETLPHAYLEERSVV